MEEEEEEEKDPMYSTPNPIKKCQRFRFMHLLTCMVAGSKRNPTTTREDCLVLFAVVARVLGIGVNGTKHRTDQGHPSDLENDPFLTSTNAT